MITVYIGKYLKILKTIRAEKWKLSDIVQRQVYQNHCARELGRVTIWGNHF
jgi:hypothetical protein